MPDLSEGSLPFREQICMALIATWTNGTANSVLALPPVSSVRRGFLSTALPTPGLDGPGLGRDVGDIWRILLLAIGGMSTHDDSTYFCHTNVMESVATRWNPGGFLACRRRVIHLRFPFERGAKRAY
jgi:hypothetical protein